MLKFEKDEQILKYLKLFRENDLGEEFEKLERELSDFLGVPANVLRDEMKATIYLPSSAYICRPDESSEGEIDVAVTFVGNVNTLAEKNPESLNEALLIEHFEELGTNDPDKLFLLSRIVHVPKMRDSFIMKAFYHSRSCNFFDVIPTFDPLKSYRSKGA